ncbi:hypothetical protein GI584_20040 [Gracilibacillus salitolerans]|uniref:Uncharacterized protein n=1 Tax=Gracilibacillus salitolerans TaxID=2663022 RepID=A0A5Q2TNA0_9BACI|nr:hypothetical protein [Gracilibacillus salitolerans]QGH36195.1 hypothetical protein GI584_20040 [Gracilibacillus salitolerans]
MGVITEQIEDLEGTLQERTDKANQAFDETLDNQSKVQRADFIFPNWEPYKNYNKGII